MAFFNDLFGDLWEMGKEQGAVYAKGKLSGQFGFDHIRAQNHVVQTEFPAVLAAFDNGQITIEQARAQIQGVADGFSRYVTDSAIFGNRGAQGAADVQALAGVLIRDLSKRQTSTSGSVFSSLSSMSPVMLGALGVGAFLLLRRK